MNSMVRSYPIGAFNLGLNSSHSGPRGRSNRQTARDRTRDYWPGVVGGFPMLSGKRATRRRSRGVRSNECRRRIKVVRITSSTSSRNWNIVSIVGAKFPMRTNQWIVSWSGLPMVLLRSWCPAVMRHKPAALRLGNRSDSGAPGALRRSPVRGAT